MVDYPKHLMANQPPLRSQLSQLPVQPTAASGHNGMSQW